MSDKNYARKAELTITFNNADITVDIDKNLKSFSYHEAADGEADDLKIVLHDRENIWLNNWLVKEMEARGGTGTINQTDSGTGSSYTVNSKIGLNVRSGKGTGYESLGNLSYGSDVTVKEISGGWATIEYSGGTGYVAAQYLDESSGGGGGSGGITVGSKVTVKQGATNWRGVSLQDWVYDTTFDVLSITDDGYIVIGLNGVVTAGMDPSSINEYTGDSVDGSDGNHAKYTKIGAVLSFLNYDGNGNDKVLDCGTFELDDVSVKGPPQEITLSATSLSYESAIRKTRKSRSWNSSYLKDIAASIASGGGYTLMYLSDYNPFYTHMLQDNTDDISFLEERAINAGLSLKVTDGAIILFDRKDYDDQDAIRTFTWGDGTYSSFSLQSTLSTTSYASCHVSYEDEDGNTYEATFTPTTNATEGEVLEVKEEVASNAEAMALAQKRLRIANKGEMTGSLTMMGDPDLVAGVNIELKNFGDFSGKWSIDQASHEVSSGGYTTKLDISKVIEGY